MGKTKLHLIKNGANGGSGKRGYQLIIWMAVGLIILVLLLLFITISILHSQRADNKKSAADFGNVLGLGYSGGQLLVGDASGIADYKDGRWKVRSDTQKEAKNVFLPIDKGYLSLGNTQNGQQLIERTAAGQKIGAFSLPKGKAGGSLAAGYYSHALYMTNNEAGQLRLSYSLDQGKTWHQEILKGIKGKVNALAVHPRKKNVLAIATDKGLFLSDDHGLTLTKLLPGKRVTSVTYGFSAKDTILAGTFDGKSEFDTIDPYTHNKVPVDISSVEQDELVSIAQNPEDTSETVLATKSKDIFVSKNNLQNWEIIAKNGRGLSGQ